MNVRNLSFVPSESATTVLSERVGAIIGTVSALFRRSLDIRVAEQRTRIERTGLAGMI